MEGCRIFILSPANSTGRRADILLSPRADFDLAARFQKQGAQIGEIFSFLSGLYFRGKLAYANRFARPAGSGGVFIITSDRGLVSEEFTVTSKDLLSFSQVPIDIRESRYIEPLKMSAGRLRIGLPDDADVILLGSVSTNKYVDPLLQIFGEQLKFPAAFVGRGDMSRGGLLLRSIDDSQELEYIPLDGAVVHGKRPPKLMARARRPQSHDNQ